MKILYAAAENAWGGFLGMIRKELPDVRFDATGGFHLESLNGYDVLIPTMCPVTRETLETADQLKLIQQCGSGLEGVDIEAATAMGVQVANVPTAISGNADSVAELGIYLMIGLLRNARAIPGSLSQRCMGEPRGMSLKGRTVGLVGLGGIGCALARRLKPFDVTLMGVRQTVRAGDRETMGLDWIGTRDDLPYLLEKSDLVVLCLPVTPESTYLMNKDTLAAMKPGSFLINLSRGGLIERQALYDAMVSGTIAGAGLDVFWEEPPDPNDPVFACNVLATPHIAGSTDLSMQGIVKGVAENIKRIRQGLPPLNVHNRV